MKEKILITVKTYPTLSKKYAELVCTAGVNEAGQWRRIYPVPFRQLNSDQKYKKYQWIEVELRKSTSDGRPETYQIAGQLVLLNDPLPTSDSWRLRREAFINKVEVHEDLNRLIKDAHDNTLRLWCMNRYFFSVARLNKNRLLRRLSTTFAKKPCFLVQGTGPVQRIVLPIFRPASSLASPSLQRRVPGT